MERFWPTRLALVLPGFLGIFLIVLISTGVSIANDSSQSLSGNSADILLVGNPMIRGTARLQKRLDDAGLQAGASAFIRIFKREAELEVWLQDGSAYRKLHTYPICYFSGFLGPKLKEGDKQSPEGFYAVSASQLNPNSSYFRSFNLGYPNAYDKANGRTGSYLMVHGNCVSIGCYAMTDDGIAEIYQLIETALEFGQPHVPVHIFPFRLTEANIKSSPVGPWRDFWSNLKTGYDSFEADKVPPTVGVRDKRYVFGSEADSGTVISGW